MYCGLRILAVSWSSTELASSWHDVQGGSWGNGWRWSVHRAGRTDAAPQESMSRTEKPSHYLVRSLRSCLLPFEGSEVRYDLHQASWLPSLLPVCGSSHASCKGTQWDHQMMTLRATYSPKAWSSVHPATVREEWRWRMECYGFCEAFLANSWFRLGFQKFWDQVRSRYRVERGLVGLHRYTTFFSVLIVFFFWHK